VIRISVEVARGVVRYRVAVQAQSIGRALEIVGREDPGREANVTFSIDPESFFVRDAATSSGAVDREVA
jgi:hypothetical protein